MRRDAFGATPFFRCGFFVAGLLRRRCSRGFTSTRCHVVPGVKKSATAVCLLWHSSSGLESFPEQPLEVAQRRVSRVPAIVIGLYAKLGHFVELVFLYTGITQAR